MGTLESLVDEIQNHCATRDRELRDGRYGCAALYRDLDWANCLARSLGGAAEMQNPRTSPERCDELADQLLALGVRAPQDMTTLGQGLVSVVLGYRAQAARRSRAGQDLARQSRRLESVLARVGGFAAPAEVTPLSAVATGN